MCRQATWRFLYGSYTVWLDVDPDQTEDEAPQRGAYCNADIHVKLAGFNADTVKEAVGQITEQVSFDRTSLLSPSFVTAARCDGSWGREWGIA
jgi:hypothetical protein